MLPEITKEVISETGKCGTDDKIEKRKFLKQDPYLPSQKLEVS